MSNQKLSPESQKLIDRMAKLNKMLWITSMKIRWMNGEFKDPQLNAMCESFFSKDGGKIPV